MINAGILDGDMVVVKRQDDADDGTFVVALLDDEATLKRFFREDGQVRLQPENDSMQPIFTRDPRIIGKVTASCAGCDDTGVRTRISSRNRWPLTYAG
jgi:repressor LexA